MQISIVIPTYNQGQYIRDCLSSIQSQTYSNLQVIIQDSNSTDETKSICEEFVGTDSRFFYFREKDSGQSDAINRGLARSQGYLWTWICSDDYYSSPNAVENSIRKFAEAHAQDSKVVGVYGNAEYVSEIGEFLGAYHQQKRSLSFVDFKLDWPLSQPSSFLLRERVDRVQGVDVKLHLGMDLDLFLKLLKNGDKLTYADQLVASVRVQSNSKSVMYRKKTAITALEIIGKHFGNTGSSMDSAYAREYSNAQKLEWLGASQALVAKSFPGLVKRLVEYRKRNTLVTSLLNEHEIVINRPSFEYRVMRSIYRAARQVLYYVTTPGRFLIELYLRKKHAK